MFKFAFLLIFYLLISAQISAQNDVGQFRFQPKKVAVGTVYHYVKTNLDGSHPEYISQYVAARDRLEVFKFHPKGERAGLVIATMDWQNFSARRLESFQVYASGERKLFATLDYNEATKNVKIMFGGKEAGETAIGHLPFHVYNFDLGSLNLAFPHLANPKKSFTIGIADPTFKENPVFEYKGEVTVSYVGEEARNNAPTRKYKIDGAGLQNRGGFIWVNKTGNYFEDVEIASPDNPDWTSFKFKLLKIEQMSRAEWEAFMKKQF